MSTHRTAALGPLSPQPDPRTPPPFVPQRTVSTEPKSEYLREVLQSRRPKGTLTPSPAQPPQPTIRESPPESDDEWAPIDDDDTRHSALSCHLRRLSMDSAEDLKTPHRPKTRAELQKDRDKMEKDSFNIRLRVVVLEEQNAKLMREVEEARERLEELEDIEDDNRELREERDMLKLKLQNVDEMLAAKDDDIAELTAINDEAMKEMEKRDTGLEEAADMILSLEEENMALRQRLASSRPTTAVTSDYSSNDGDKLLKNRASLASIAESTLSAAEHYSDYFSQPASPQVTPSKTPSPKKLAGPHSTKVRSMIYANARGNGSVMELRKRISHVSLTDRDSMLSNQALSAISSVPSLPKIKPSRRGGGRAETPVHHSVSAETLQPSTPRRGSLHPPTLALRDRFYQDQTSQIPLSPTIRCQSAASDPSEQTYRIPLRDSNRDFNQRSGSASQDAPELTPELAPDSPPSPPESTETDFTQPHQQNWWESYQRMTQRRPGVVRTSTAPNLFNPAEDENEFMDRIKSSTTTRR